jgi:hypothetical protein
VMKPAGNLDPCAMSHAPDRRERIHATRLQLRCNLVAEVSPQPRESEVASFSQSILKAACLICVYSSIE